ncbi:MAG: hypothetical protein ABI878_02945 [Acidobacteriota bacterium]
MKTVVENSWYDIVGTLGVGIIVLTYILLQAERLRSGQPIYSFLNAVRSGMILVSLYYSFNLPSFVVEVFWLVISVFGIAKALLKNN